MSRGAPAAAEAPGLPPIGALRAWAARVLWAERLEDKLCDVDPAATDPGPLRGAPAAPGRPPGLGFSTRDPRPHKPSDAALAEARARGALLHDFANHELLALELMALQLLRAEALPPAFVRGLAAVLRDEQRHLRLYIDRMGALGVTFGEVPVNGFFWRALAPVEEPLAALEGMSLVLEQANLDFCQYWAARLRGLGDAESAALLDVVFEDEIGHVRHGLAWSRRWRPPGQTDWDRLVAQPEPLGLGRCRGPVFCAAGRERAGLEPEAIARLAVEGRSRGRLPAVWSFDPGVEEAALALATGRPRAVSAPARALSADLALVPLALLVAGDLLLVPARPPPALLARVAEAGLALPELVVDPGALAGRALGPGRPWGWPGAPALAGLRPPAPTPDPALWGKAWAAARVAAARAACGLPAAPWPVVLTDLNALDVALAAVLAAHPVAVLKAPFGASGRGAQRVVGALTDAQRRWAAGALGAQGALVLMPWLARALDLSQHADLLPDGQLVLKGQVRFHNDVQGRFCAVSTHPPQLDLPPALQRALTADGARPALLAEVGQAVFDVLRADLVAAGYHGPLGLDQLWWAPEQPARVDAVADPTEGPFQCLPLVELNPRFTFGRVGLNLRARQAPRARGRLHLAPAAGLRGLTLDALPPLRLDGAGRVLEGIVPLSDPATATQAVALWVVAPDAPALVAAEAALGLRTPLL